MKQTLGNLLFLLILLAVCISINVNAQENINETSTWYYSGGYIDGDYSKGSYHHIEYIDGDTLIADKKYYKIYRNYFDTTTVLKLFNKRTNQFFNKEFEIIDTTKHEYVAAIREEANRIYVVKINNARPEIYSTNHSKFEVGSSFPQDKNCYIENNVITKIDTIAFGDQTSRRYYFKNSDSYYVEGVGGMYGLGKNCYAEDVSKRGALFLNCYSKNGHVTKLSPFGACALKGKEAKVWKTEMPVVKENVAEETTAQTIYETPIEFITNEKEIGREEVFRKEIAPKEKINLKRLYPNPAVDYVMVEVESNIERLSIHDYQGREVYASNSSNYPRKFKIDLSKMETGNYVLRVYFEDGLESMLFRIEK